MANEAGNIINKEINEKLKKIMEQRNIHNDIAVNADADALNDEYQKAAQLICEYMIETGYQFDVSAEEMQSLYTEFQNRFSPEKLIAIPEDELLRTLFYTADSTNDSLCYYLEFHAQNRKCFGSIAGGSSYKFGLFQKKEGRVWITGSPGSPIELSESDALILGKQIRDCIVRGAKLISEAKLETIADYEKLDDDLNTEIKKYAKLAWVHKYYHMIFPDKFSVWHSNEWQNHMLYAYGITPSQKYYGRSGQLAKIFNLAHLSAPAFAHASFDWFGDIKQFARIGTSDSAGNYFDKWRQDGVAAIGWNKLDSLDNYIAGSDINRTVLYDRLVEEYYHSDTRTASRKAGEIQNFYRTNENTVFVAMEGEKLLALGDHVGQYFFDRQKPMAHCKKVNWHMCFGENEKLPDKSEGLLTTCVSFSKPENLLYLYHKYYYDLKQKKDEYNVVKDVEMADEIFTERKPRNQKIHPLNQIIYGAPGTGKTYSTVEYALAVIENREAEKGRVNAEERAEKRKQYEEYIKKGQIVFTTFHQSYGYEEFIQGIRPKPVEGNVSFEIADGIFKKIADKAMPDQNNNYVIIIDEINRGNISRIFGELITLVEEDKRWGELNQMSAVLPFGDKFAVPNNLYIIGTMNSADKSISLIDAALRRRFDFMEMAPDSELIEDSGLKGVMVSLNQYLRKELRSTDLLIGHSYFIGRDISRLGEIMNRNIIPLLYEYFYDDEAKVRKALECIGGTGFEIDSQVLGRICIKKKENE